MRDPKRIPRICKKLEEYWSQEENQNLRLGQLICNLLGEEYLWFVEDTKTEDLLDRNTIKPEEIPELVWKTYEGKRILPHAMTDDHIRNIIKYVFTVGGIPVREIMQEARKRGILQSIGGEILPADGYKPPEEIRGQLNG